MKRMLEKGVKVSAGTDATRVASYNPWVSLSWLVTGKTVGGLRDHAPAPTCLDREAALRMWTENVTWFSNEVGKKGRIEVGPAGRPGGAPTATSSPAGESEIAGHHGLAHDGRRQGGLGRRRVRRAGRGHAAAGHARLVAGARRRLRQVRKGRAAASERAPLATACGCASSCGVHGHRARQGVTSSRADG